jgi:hypothetical protein
MPSEAGGAYRPAARGLETPGGRSLPAAWRLRSYPGMNSGMSATPPPGTRRVTANLPVALLRRACAVTGEGITETLTRGLEMVRRSAAADRARSLRGKIDIRLDLETSRERPRR